MVDRKGTDVKMLLRAPDAGGILGFAVASALPRCNLPVSFSMLLIMSGVVFESVIWGFVV